MVDPQPESVGTTHTYVARAWYRDTATLFNLASFLVIVLQETTFQQAIPEKWHPGVIAAVTVLNLLIRFHSSTRPVALSEGTPVQVASIPPKAVPQVDKGEVSNSTRSRFIPLLLIPLLFTADCATNRHKAVIASTGLYAAIAVIDDTERTLVTSGQITAEQHAKLNPDILILLKAGRAANDAVIATTVPQPVKDVVTALATVAQDVSSLLPDGPTKAKLQTAIISAQSAVSLLLAFHTTTGAMNHAREPYEDPALGADRSATLSDCRNGVFAFALGA